MAPCLTAVVAGPVGRVLTRHAGLSGAGRNSPYGHPADPADRLQASPSSRDTSPRRFTAVRGLNRPLVRSLLRCDSVSANPSSRLLDNCSLGDRFESAVFSACSRTPHQLSLRLTCRLDSTGWAGRDPAGPGPRGFFGTALRSQRPETADPSRLSTGLALLVNMASCRLKTPRRKTSVSGSQLAVVDRACRNGQRASQE